MTNRLTRAELLRRAALGSAAAAAPGLLGGTAQGARRIARAQTDGNKPFVKKYLTAFTERVAEFPRIAYYPLKDGGHAAVAMVIDEVLVGKKAANNAAVKSLLQSQAINTQRTVFGGLKSPPKEDIQIWRLKSALGQQASPDVAMFVWAARKLLKAKGIPPEQVAPNHVLIPSFDYHTCPGGPPEQTGLKRKLPPRSSKPRTVEVVVIDSGYVPDGPAKGRIDVVERGEWFTLTPSTPGQFTPPYIWAPEPPEPLYVTVNGHLATLVAHANFVAGVIAQGCRQARITLVSHNGALVQNDKGDTPIPTEASVARSLWKHRGAQVINVGFAFVTLPSQQSAIGAPVPSWALELALSETDQDQTVVVAPAGNQNSRTPFYPAAFHLNGAHQNVIGVGSISPGGTRSKFSNYGPSGTPWVACCTQGEGVLSSFITHWQGETEDAEANSAYPVKRFTSGWARWSGTSFAAPKVAAAIARGVAAGNSPFAAWAALAAQYPTGLMMGKKLSGLPPRP